MNARHITLRGNIPGRTDDDPPTVALDPALVLPRRLADLARTRPDHLFLQEVSGQSRTFAQCHEQMLRICSYLQQLGLRRGDRLLSFLPSSIDAHLLWMGSACAGVWEVTSNPELRGEFLRHIIRDCGAKVCFARPEHAECAHRCESRGVANRRGRP